jgi:hypothetical protein
MSRPSALAVLCSLMIAAPSAARLSASSGQSATPMPDAASPSSRQDRATPPVPPPPPPQGRATTPPPPAPPPETSQERPANVRVELAISEAQAGTPTTKKVVLITSDMSRGSIRSAMRSPTEGDVTLNVDAHPMVQRDGRIELELIFVYTPQRSPDAETAGAHSTDLQEQMKVLLTDGKPLLVSQSADPRGDRKVTVEVTATIMK